jgi:hypothetical protein
MYGGEQLNDRFEEHAISRLEHARQYLGRSHESPESLVRRVIMGQFEQFAKVNLDFNKKREHTFKNVLCLRRDLKNNIAHNHCLHMSE